MSGEEHVGREEAVTRQTVEREGGRFGVKWAVIPALVVGLIIIPVFASNYVVYVLALAMIYAMLTASYDLMTGYTGPLAFCPAAFWGVGAYASALLTLRAGLPFWVALPIAGAIVFFFAALIGYPALRLTGHYFAVTTFFLGHFVYLIFLNARGLTNGPMGLRGIRPPEGILGIDFTSLTASYYLILFFGLVIVVFLVLLVRSSMGRYLISIRENEEFAQAMGINTSFYKVLAFSISAGLMGVVGSLFAHFFRLLHPSEFSWAASEMIVVMALVGGTGTLIGPIIGAGLLTFFLELVKFAPELRFVMMSVLLVVVLVIEPKGLAGIYRRIVGGR